MNNMTETKEDLTQRGTHTSASNAAADARCQGRHLMQRGLPDIKSEAAEHGTTVHDALAKQSPEGLTIEQEEIYDACNALEAKLVAQFFPDAAGAKSVPIREKRYWIGWADGLRHSAQIDSVHRKGTRALIVEYKTLAGAVGVTPQNMQLRDQACVYDHNCPLLTEIGVAVVQPLFTHSPEITVYTKADITRSLAELYQRVNLSNKPNAPRTPGEIQCKWCRAAKAGTCPEYNRWAAVTVTQDQNLIEVPVSQWTPAMRATFLDRFENAQKWLDMNYAYLKLELKNNPDAIPGYELKPGAVKSTIINPQAVFTAFSEAGGTLEQFMECISVGKGDLKAAVKSVTKAKGKKLDAALEGIIGQNIQTKQNEPSIVKKNI
jgi:uncharacterized protein DUF2800